MTAVTRAWRAEADQALARRDLRGGAVALCVATLGYGLLLATLLGSGVAPDAIGLVAGDEASGFAVAFQTARALVRLLALLLLVWSAGAVAGELEQGTHRQVLLRVPRGAWVVGKALHLFALAAGLSLLVLVMALLAGGLRLGLHGIDVGNVQVWSVAGLLGTAFAAWAWTLFPLFSIVSLGLLVSCVLRSAQAAITTALFVAVALWVVGLLPAVADFGFVGTLNWPWDVAINHGEGMKTLSFADRWLPHLGVNLAWTLLLLVAASAVLSRRDLH